MDKFTSNFHEEIGNRIVTQFPLVIQKILQDDWGIKVSGVRQLREGESETVALTFRCPTVALIWRFNDEMGVKFYNLLLYLHQQQIVTVDALFISSKEEHDIMYAWLPLSGIDEPIPTKRRAEDNG